MMLTGAQAIAAARKQLRRDGSDPRDVLLFEGLDFRTASESDIESLRNLICGALSQKDRRPWSNNGVQNSPYEKKTYLGWCSVFI